MTSDIVFAAKRGHWRAARHSAPYAVAVVWTLGVTMLALSVDWPWIFPVDDAYITMHNAQALRLGSDPHFGSPALYGATSPVHLLLVAGMQAIMPPVAGQFLLSVVALCAYLVGVAQLASDARCADWRLGPILAAATLGGATVLQLFDGLEGGLACAAIVWATVFAARPPNRAVAALCGLLPFIRPELAILGLILLGRQEFIRLRENRKDRWRLIAFDIATAGAVAAPFLLWNLATFGSVLPNTVRAKAAYFANDFGWGLNANLVFKFSIMALGPTLLALAGAARSSLKYALLLFVALFYAGYWMTLPAALAWVSGAYLLPLLAVGIWGFCQIATRKRTFAAITLLTVAWIALSARAEMASFAAHRAIVSDGLAAGAWLGDHVPATAPVMVHDDGAIAEHNSSTLVDVVGLKTPWAPAIHEQLTGPSRGRLKGDAVDLIARRARIHYLAVMNDGDGFWRSTATALEKHGWRLQMVRPRETPGGYDIFRADTP